MNAKKISIQVSPSDPLDCEDLLIALIDPGSGAVVEKSRWSPLMCMDMNANFAALVFYLRVSGPNLVETWSGTPVDFLCGIIPRLYHHRLVPLLRETC